MLIRYSLFAALLLLTVSGSHAGPMEDATKLYSEGDYSRAYRMLHSLARGGEVEAQYYLGGMLVDGLGVDANPEKGIFWLKQAVEKEHSAAAIMLSKIYLSGLGVPIDVDKGVYYLELGESFKDDDEADECD